MQEHLSRKLAAVLYADVAGYSRLMAEDEEGTHRILSMYLDLITEAISTHRGHVGHFAGDAVLADFNTAVGALECAVDIQTMLKRDAANLPEHQRIRFRIGINLGDLIVDRGEVHGEGVNVAARLESLADPGGICISETVCDAIANKLPLAYEFMGEKSVKNIPKPVRAYRVLMEPEATTRTDMRPLPDLPSIAVLPFTNMSGEPKWDYFSDGITEDVITNLSKFPDLFVIARHSTFVYKNKSIDVRQIGNELGVRYVVEGSVQHAENTLRITVQLVDTATAHHLWAQRYDRVPEELFAAQDEVSMSIAATLMNEELGALTKAENERSLRKHPSNLTAYDYMLRGNRRYYEEDMTGARQMYEKAIECDPGFAEAYESMAWTYIQSLLDLASEAPKEDLRLAGEWAQQALALDSRNYETHRAFGMIHLLEHDYEKSRAAFLRAEELNPNCADLLVDTATALTYFGQPEDAIDYIKHAMRLNPHYPDWYLWQLGISYDVAERYEDAVRELKKVKNPQL